MNTSMQKAVLTLKKTKSQRACLDKAYDIVTSRVEGPTIETYTRFWLLFQWNLDKLWKRKGLMHCNQQNTLLRALLLQSGKFSKQDIKRKWTTIKGSPHQYLQVKIGNKWIAVDPWGKHPLGLKVGEHAGF